MEEICYVCEQMANRRPAQHQALLQNPSSRQTARCLLCARQFCATHKSKIDENVCEINHQTYYAKHPHISGIFPTLEERERRLGAGEGL
jgi:hypothetical protein